MRRHFEDKLQYKLFVFDYLIIFSLYVANFVVIESYWNSYPDWKSFIFLVGSWLTNTNHPCKFVHLIKVVFPNLFYDIYLIGHTCRKHYVLH